MKVNQATVDLIKEFEGFRAETYRDSAGVLTIGYGTTGRAGVGLDPHPGQIISRAEAEFYLQKGIDQFAAKIAPHITPPINANEFGAFVSLAYNIGPSAFLRSSALRHFNAGDKAKASAAIALWNKATVNGKKTVLRGLARRREAEQALFRTPVPALPTTTATPAIGVFSGLIAAIAAFFAWRKN